MLTNKILVPVGFSEQSLAALKQACLIAKIKKSEVCSKLINLKNVLKNKITLYPHLFCTSSEKKTGLEELRAYIAMIAKN